MDKETNTVKQAGGFIIQLMPFADDAVIAKLEEKLAAFSSVTTVLDEGKTPEEMLQLLLGDLELEITDTMPVRFFCNCSKDRVEKALISIGKKDMEEMIADGKDIEVNCQFCNTAYNFSTEELKKMLKRCTR